MEGMEEPLLPGKRSSKWVPTVEPVIFLVSLATATASVTIQSFFLHRICEFNYANNQSINLESFCKNLTHFKEQEAEVETEAGRYASYRVFITAGPPLILALFWGELNDRLGSKLLLFVPVGGYLLSNVTFYILAQFPRSHLSWLLVALLPTGLTGGAITFTVSITKLIVHNSTNEDRTFRIGLAESAMLVGGPAGLILGAKILDWGGFSTVFLVSGSLEITAMLYAAAFVRDDKPQHGSGRSERSSSALALVRDGVRVFSGPYKRLMLILVFIICVRTFIMSGNTTLMFLYTRFRFDWDQLTFSSYFTYDGVLAALGVMTVSTVGLKIYKVSDALVGAVCATSFVIGCTIWAFANHPWLMYAGSTVQLSEGISIIIVRSMISSVVVNEDVGKALSFLAIPESLMPFLATPIYTAIYTSTLSGFIGTAFLMSSCLNVFVAIAFAYIYLAYPVMERRPIGIDTGAVPVRIYTEERTSPVTLLE